MQVEDGREEGEPAAVHVYERHPHGRGVLSRSLSPTQIEGQRHEAAWTGGDGWRKPSF